MKKMITSLAMIACAVSSLGAQRPNFLFIYTDDQRWDAMSVVQKEQGDRARFPWFTTPNMDRLAAEGVRFRNAFVVCSLCAPSRAVNLTGRYNHENGIASNFRSFPIDNVTHATQLRAAGYTTGYIGKWHMGSQRERPGFDFHASFIGHARYVDPPFIVDGKDVPTKGWIDDISTDYAVDFIKKQKDAAKPWSLVVGFKSPHGPTEPPERAKDRFANEQARSVPNMDTPVPYIGEAKKRDKPPEKVPVNLNYFRCVSAADDCLGRLLAALDETKQAENTVVIYTSDNGYYLGEHGLGDKRSAYDESLLVPFLVRAPMLGTAARGRVFDDMVLNLDLAESLLDFAGVAIPKEMQGKSWKPLLTGDNAGWRQSWFYEYFAEKQRGSRVPDITAVRTTNAKLVKYPGHDDWTEMFDLAADPFETKNLFADPTHAELRKKLEAEHDKLAKEAGYKVPNYVDRPDWWGKSANAASPAKAGIMIEFNCQKLDGQRVADSSGNNNHGESHGVSIVEGRDGKKAMRFSGDTFIDVPKSPSQDPSETAVAITVGLKAEKADGVILARGGKTSGYALTINNGKPVFTVNVANKQTQITGTDSILDRWTKLEAKITTEKKLLLIVDGKTVASGKIAGLIPKDPNDAMQIGADEGSPVIDPHPPKFTGLIDAVKIERGETKE